MSILSADEAGAPAPRILKKTPTSVSTISLRPVMNAIFIFDTFVVPPSVHARQCYRLRTAWIIILDRSWNGVLWIMDG